MKNRILKFSTYLCILMLVFSTDSLYSQQTKFKMTPQENMPRFGLGFLAGYAMPSEENYNGGSFSYGGNIYLMISKNIAVEVNAFHFQHDVKGSSEGLSKGILTINPVGISLQGRLPITPYLVPYVVAGGSYYLNEFNLDEKILDDWASLGFDLEEKVESGMGYHVGAGLDFFVSRNFALNLDGKYFINNMEGSWSIVEQNTSEEVSGQFDNLDMSSIFVGFGLKLVF